MADRIDFYLGQLVTESDLDTLQANLADSVRKVMADQVFHGVMSGFSVSEHAGVPDLTVDIAGPGVAYDQEGRRIHLPGSVTQPCATDSNGSPTAVVTPGNERWVSLFALFDEVASGLEIDDNGVGVLTDVQESYQILVVQGAEALAGTAARPALLADGLLIADILLAEGDTQIFDAAIESDDSGIPTTRFQWAFRLDASSPAQVYVGTVPDALQATLSELNTHIAELGNAHDASAIVYDASAIPTDFVNWAAATEVQGALDGASIDIPLAVSRSALDARTVESSFAGSGTSGVLFGYTVTGNGIDLVVTVAPGLAEKTIDQQHAATFRDIASQPLDLTAYVDGANPRWIAIELNTSTGALGVTTGLAAASPIFPKGVASRIPLAYVYLAAAAVSVATTDVVDCRPLINESRGLGVVEVNGTGGIGVSTVVTAFTGTITGRWASGVRWSCSGFTTSLSATTAYWRSGETYAGLAGDHRVVHCYLLQPPYPLGYDADIRNETRTFHHTGARILGALSGSLRGAILGVTAVTTPNYTPVGNPSAAIVVTEGVWDGVAASEGVYLGSITYIDGVGFNLATVVGDTVCLAGSTFGTRNEAVAVTSSGTLFPTQRFPFSGGTVIYPVHICAYLMGVRIQASVGNTTNFSLMDATENVARFTRAVGSEISDFATQVWLNAGSTYTWSFTVGGGVQTATTWVNSYKDGILAMR